MLLTLTCGRARASRRWKHWVEFFARSIKIPKFVTSNVNEILQLVFYWSGEHMHRFRIHGRDYGTSQLVGLVFDEDARQVPLSRFHLHCGERFRYEYDFIANWKLDIRLEKRLPFYPGRPIPLCTAGRRAAPP